jgi:hypothetical protein
VSSAGAATAVPAYALPQSFLSSFQNVTSGDNGFAELCENALMLKQMLTIKTVKIYFVR